MLFNLSSSFEERSTKESRMCGAYAGIGLVSERLQERTSR